MMTFIMWFSLWALAASVQALTINAFAGSISVNTHMTMTNTNPSGQNYGNVAAIKRDLAYLKVTRVCDNLYAGTKLPKLPRFYSFGVNGNSAKVDAALWNLSSSVDNIEAFDGTNEPDRFGIHWNDRSSASAMLTAQWELYSKIKSPAAFSNIPGDFSSSPDYHRTDSVGVLPVTIRTRSTIGTQTVGRGADTLSLLLSEDQYAGDVAFTVFINHHQVGNVYTVQALHSLGQDQQFHFNGNWGENATATINFINAASNGLVGNGNTRKFYIDKASYDGNALVLPANNYTGEFKNTSSVTLNTNVTTGLAAASDKTVAPDGLGSRLNLSGYHLTYDDEFDTMPTMSPVAGQAQYDTTLAGFPYPNVQGMRILANGDQQYYTDRTTGDDPFSIVNGALVITATYVGAGNTPAGGGAAGPSYTSGQITTEGTFSQQYGYFEMRAKLPQGVGMWPAFWMLDDNSYLRGAWDPELDVMEAFGAKSTYGEGGPTQSHWAIHTPSYSPGEWATLPNGGNAYNGYHTYGVLWTPQTIALYIDGSQVGQIATPSDFTEKMYMIVNLAVGGSWPGNATGEDARMSIDYLRAYSDNPSIPAVVLQQISSPDGNADTNLYGAIALKTPPILATTLPGARP